MLAGILALSPLISGIMGIVNKVIADQDTRDQIERDIKMYTLTSDFQNAMAQIELAKVDQASESMWKSGWRPFIGWTCGTSFAWHFLCVPILVFIGACFNHPIPLPEFDIQTMMTVLLGMLGLGGYRTYEKIENAKLASSERINRQSVVVERTVPVQESQYGPSSPTFDKTNPKVKTKRGK